MNLVLSIVSDDGFQCYNTAKEKPVHANIDDELQLLPNEATLTPETGIKIEENNSAEPKQTLRRPQRLPFAKQNAKLGGVSYYPENNEKKVNIYCVSQESQNNQPETNIDEELTHRNIRTLLQKRCEDRKIRNYNQKLPQKTDFIRRGECEMQRSSCQL